MSNNFDGWIDMTQFYRHHNGQVPVCLTLGLTDAVFNKNVVFQHQSMGAAIFDSPSVLDSLSFKTLFNVNVFQPPQQTHPQIYKTRYDLVSS